MVYVKMVNRPFSQLPKASVSKRGYIKALIFTRNVLYLASFWKWEFLEIGIEVSVLGSFVLWDCYGYAITSFISQLCVRPFLEVSRQEIWYCRFWGGISQFSLLLLSPETPDTQAILLLPITTPCRKMGQILSPKHSPTVQRDTTMTLSHMQPLRGQVRIKWLSLPQLHLIIKPLGLVP